MQAFKMVSPKAMYHYATLCLLYYNSPFSHNTYTTFKALRRKDHFTKALRFLVYLGASRPKSLLVVFRTNNLHALNFLVCPVLTNSFHTYILFDPLCYHLIAIRDWLYVFYFFLHLPYVSVCSSN